MDNVVELARRAGCVAREEDEVYFVSTLKNMWRICLYVSRGH